MVTNSVEFREPKVQKFSVTCKTCRITETFYSEWNVSRFKSNHLHHEVTLEAPGGKKIEERPEERREAPTELPLEEPVVEPVVEANKAVAPAEETPARRAGNSLAKLVIDTRLLSLQAQPVLFVQGLKTDGKTAFVLTYGLNEATALREFLAGGRHEERGFSVLGSSELSYVWEPSAIEFTDDARQKLLEQGMKWVESPITISRAGKESPRPAETEVRPPKRVTVAESATPTVNAPSPRGSLDVKQDPAIPPPQAVKQLPPAREKQLAAVQTAVRPSPKVERPDLQTKATENARAAKERKPEPEGLLLAKSSYIQDGEENMREAVRLSQLLKAFRWNVEPVYTIGVILDDNLSIETNKTEISGALLRRVEDAGYRLSAVTTASGRPTAWFKKKAPGEGEPRVPLDGEDKGREPKPREGLFEAAGGPAGEGEQADAIAGTPAPNGSYKPDEQPSPDVAN